MVDHSLAEFYRNVLSHGVVETDNVLGRLGIFSLQGDHHILVKFLKMRRNAASVLKNYSRYTYCIRQASGTSLNIWIVLYNSTVQTYYSLTVTPSRIDKKCHCKEEAPYCETASKIYQNQMSNN